MNVTKHDAILLFYNFAVVLSGAHIIWEVEFSNRAMIFVVSLAFGLIWTIYFRWSMVERLADHPKLVAMADGNGDAVD